MVILVLGVFGDVNCCLELEFVVVLVVVRVFVGFWLFGSYIEVIVVCVEKGGFLFGMFKECMIVVIIEYLEFKKECCDKEVVNDGGGGDIYDGVLVEENVVC